MPLTLAEFRQKYPAYNDMSDQQLADALHDKFYSDIPKNEFYQKIKFSPSLSGSKTTPAKRDFASLLSQALKQTEGQGKFLPTHPIQDTADVEQGAIEAPLAFGQNVVRAVTSVLPQSVRNNSYVQAINNEDWNKETAPIGSGRQSLGSNLLRGAGQFALPGAAEEEQAANLATMLPDALKGGSSILGRLLSGAEGGLSTPEQNASSTPDDALKTALLNVLIPATTEGAANTLEKMRPSKALRGTLSPEELQANVEAAKGTPTALGDVVQSPGLKKKYENVISKLPFAGASKKMQKVAAAVGTQAKNVLSKILGTTNLETVGDQLSDEGTALLHNMFGGDLNPENATSDLVNHIQEKFSEEKAGKNADYLKRNQIAENDPNFKMEAPKFADAVNDYSNSIGELVLLKHDPQMAKTFARLSQYKGPLAQGLPKDAASKLAKEPSISEAQGLKARLNTYAKIAKNSPDSVQRSISNIYKTLASRLDEDIHDSIAKSGNKELAAQQEKADKNYAANFAPFLNDTVFKYANGNVDPDTIVNSLIKTGKDSDRHTLLSGATKLPGDTRQLLGKAYFSRAIDKMTGILDPKKLSKLISDLGPKQLKELIPSESDRKSLFSFFNKNKLTNHFSKAINSDGTVNPAALARLSENLFKSPRTATHLLGPENEADLHKFANMQHMNKDVPSVLANQPTGKGMLDWGGLLAGLVGGHALGGPLGAVAGVGASAGLGRGLTKAITSEKLRESLVKAMLENKIKFKAGGPLTKTAQILAQAGATAHGRQ